MHTQLAHHHAFSVSMLHSECRIVDAADCDLRVYNSIPLLRRLSSSAASLIVPRLAAPHHIVVATSSSMYCYHCRKRHIQRESCTTTSGRARARKESALDRHACDAARPSMCSLVIIWCVHGYVVIMCCLFVFSQRRRRLARAHGFCVLLRLASAAAASVHTVSVFGINGHQQHRDDIRMRMVDMV
jgi:hypothetical protein